MTDVNPQAAEAETLDQSDAALAAMQKEAANAEKNQRVALEGKFSKFGFVVMPSEAAPPILDLPTRTVLHEWLFEINAKKALKAVGVEPRTRALLSGPPGCGKTTLAHHIAARLGLPMLVVTSHTLISKWLGETGGNIGELFRSTRKLPHGLVLFFDEFDAIAKARDQLGGQGADTERSNMTTALLQEMDRYHGMLFAATNVVKGIDQAVWRRFQMQVEIGMPGPEEREAIVRLYMRPYWLEAVTAGALGDMMTGASPALIKECCEQLKRSLVLAPKIGQSTLFPDMLRRMVTTITPPEQQDPPALWANMAPLIAETRELAWPPVVVREGDRVP